MDNITFQSKIRYVSRPEFNKIVSGYGKQNYIKYPWTIKESIFSDKLYTKGVEDCTFIGINDGLNVFGLHLCPTMEANFDFEKIKNFIKSKIDLNTSNLQGFILGGRRHSENNGSYRLYEQLEGLLKKYNIIYSKFKGGRLPNDIAYNCKNDEWLISSDFARNEHIRENYDIRYVIDQEFEDIKLSPEDEISW